MCAFDVDAGVDEINAFGHTGEAGDIEELDTDTDAGVGETNAFEDAGEDGGDNGLRIESSVALSSSYKFNF